MAAPATPPAVNLEPGSDLEFEQFQTVFTASFGGGRPDMQIFLADTTKAAKLLLQSESDNAGGQIPSVGIAYHQREAVAICFPTRILLVPCTKEFHPGKKFTDPHKFQQFMNDNITKVTAASSGQLQAAINEGFLMPISHISQLVDIVRQRLDTKGLGKLDECETVEKILRVVAKHILQWDISIPPPLEPNAKLFSGRMGEWANIDQKVLLRLILESYICEMV